MLRSVLHCALPSPLLGIIRSMNISLITAEKAEQSQVEDACHTAPSARITPPTPDIAKPHSSITPALHVSSTLPIPLPFSHTLCTFSLSQSFFFPQLLLFLYRLAPPCLHHFFCLSVSLCHWFLFFLYLHAPPSSPPSLFSLDG